MATSVIRSRFGLKPVVSMSIIAYTRLAKVIKNLFTISDCKYQLSTFLNETMKLEIC